MDITSTKQLEESTQAQNNFIEIKDGEKATLRIVSGIKGVKEHNLEIKGKRRGITCPEAMEEWEAKEEDRPINSAIKCPVCKSTNFPDRKVKTQFLAIAIDDKSQVGVLKKGPSVYKVITDLMGEGYNLSETPVIISRKGEKLDTEYTVLPARKDTPLTDEEKQAVAKFQEGYDIEMHSKPMSYENIERKMRGEDLIFDDEKAEDTLTLPD
jgi:predicted Zn-ribbon and HTH transcriptional regulator